MHKKEDKFQVIHEVGGFPGFPVDVNEDDNKKLNESKEEKKDKK